MEDAGGPVSDSPIQDSRRIGKILHPHIHREDSRPCRNGHPAHRSRPPGKSPGNLAGHGAVRLGYPLLRHSVVRAEDYDRFLIETNIRALRQRGDLHDRILQKAEAMKRMLDPVPPLVRKLPGIHASVAFSV